MDNIKVFNLLTDLDNVFCQICTETDAYLDGILQWADELVGTVQNEFSTTKDSPSFLLPKTPSEKKALYQKAKNTLLSQSVLNITVDCNEAVFLDETISTRTRAARRAVTSKKSQLCLAKDKQQNNTSEIKKEISVIEGNTEEKSSEVTFIVPQTASTRTKPVVNNKQLESVLVFKSPVGNLNRTLSGTPLGRRSLKKISRTLSGSPIIKQNISKNSNSCIERISRSKTYKSNRSSPKARGSKKRVSRTLSPVERPTRNTRPRTVSESPRESKSRKLKSASPSPHKTQVSLGLSCASRSSKKEPNRTPSQSPIKRSSSVNAKLIESSEKTVSLAQKEPVTIKVENTSKITSTFIVSPKEKVVKDTNCKRHASKGKKGEFDGISHTSTPVATVNGEKTLVPNLDHSPDMICDEADSSTEKGTLNADVTYPLHAHNSTSGESEENPVPKKKRKLKKNDETFKENIEEAVDTVRITRTKSKAIKQMMEENEAKQADFAVIAKKLLNRAKITSLKKNQLASLLENNSTPRNGPGGHGPFGNLNSKSKYHILLSSSKKLKTPLATLPNSAIKIAKPSGDPSKPPIEKQDSPDQNLTKSSKDKTLEKEDKLKSKKEKEKEAALKRQKVLKSRQEELKRKNELKQQQAMKQREKLEKEKFFMIQSEKEKEEKHKLIVQERQMKLKEEAFKKKMLTQQKIAETNERRRLEEEARIAKLKEIEAEEQRLALEKQKEQERQEKRAQERLALKKAREEYEMQMKQELEAEKLKAEKIMTTKKYLPSPSRIESACKRPKFGMIKEKREWDYKPRNENDYGLEDEHSEEDSEDERGYEKKRPPVAWGHKIINGMSPLVKVITLEMMCEYMPCYQKTPDVSKMFKMTPSKQIKRTSSAIWNTPSS